MTDNGSAAGQWREYTLMIPVGVARILDKALDEQVRMENRQIDMSEFACWLLGLGLAYRQELLKSDIKAQRRIIEP